MITDGHVELGLALAFTFVAVLGVSTAAIAYIAYQWRHEQEVIKTVEAHYNREIAVLQRRVSELEAQVSILVRRANGVSITAGDDVRIGGDAIGQDKS